LISDLDKNSDGKINFEEFQGLIEKINDLGDQKAIEGNQFALEDKKPLAIGDE